MENRLSAIHVGPQKGNGIFTASRLLASSFCPVSFCQLFREFRRADRKIRDRKIDPAKPTKTLSDKDQQAWRRAGKPFDEVDVPRPLGQANLSCWLGLSMRRSTRMPFIRGSALPSVGRNEPEFFPGMTKPNHGSSAIRATFHNGQLHLNSQTSHPCYVGSLALSVQAGRHYSLRHYGLD